MHRPPRGFVALLSVLIVSALLSVLAIVASTDIFFARDAAADEAAYRSSVYAAWSCVRMALNRLSADPDRFVGEGTTTITLSETALCKIGTASTTSTLAGVFAQGHVGNSYVNLYASASRASSTAPFFIRTWREP